MWCKSTNWKSIFKKQGVSRDSPFVLRSSSPLIPPATRQNDIYHAQTCVKQEIFDSKTTISPKTRLSILQCPSGPVKTACSPKVTKKSSKILSSYEEMDDTVDDDVLIWFREAERDSLYRQCRKVIWRWWAPSNPKSCLSHRDWNDPSTKSMSYTRESRLMWRRI